MVFQWNLSCNVVSDVDVTQTETPSEVLGFLWCLEWSPQQISQFCNYKTESIVGQRKDKSIMVIPKSPEWKRRQNSAAPSFMAVVRSHSRFQRFKHDKQENENRKNNPLIADTFVTTLKNARKDSRWSAKCWQTASLSQLKVKSADME